MWDIPPIGCHLYRADATLSVCPSGNTNLYAGVARLESLPGIQLSLHSWFSSVSMHVLG